MTATSTSSVGPPLTLSQNPPRYSEISVEWPRRMVVQADHNVNSAAVLIGQSQGIGLANPMMASAFKHTGRFRKEGVLLLRGLDLRLSKDLPSDLQKLVSDGGGFGWDESAKESDC
ncbi:hypothetical protein F0562_007621 [Nyssa sinensis]|uniref:Uncharacterized protein n=1 Tax=Nyssa sinensis TaxID=561372 RepID=A0A5J5A799_9ASTE|nr:hypothetical protein F0562_007621 [Nyssa sinensis]